MQLQLFIKEEIIPLPTNQLEAVLYFVARLDIEMVNSFLDEDRTYQDFPKYQFISKLIDAFGEFEKAGDKELTIFKGQCSGCSKGCQGYTFLGKHGHFIDLLFERDDHKILDIYECLNFKNDAPIPGKFTRVEIDRQFSLFDNAPF